MNKDDIAKRKFEMLMRAVEQVGQQDAALDELKDAAFEVLLLHPVCDRSEWAQILVEQYGTELIDAYGPDPDEIYASLCDLWKTPYYDENSGLERDYKDWAEAFATEAAVQMYYGLTDK
mgnify:CR=1 FL=1